MISKGRFSNEPALFFEYKIDSQNQKNKANQVIPSQRFSLKKDKCKNGEYCQGYYFLHHFEFKQAKGSSIFFVTYSVGWNLKEIFKESYSPTNQYDSKQTQIRKPGHFFEFQMSIPSKGHEYIRHN